MHKRKAAVAGGVDGAARQVAGADLPVLAEDALQPGRVGERLQGKESRKRQASGQADGCCRQTRQSRVQSACLHPSTTPGPCHALTAWSPSTYSTRPNRPLTVLTGAASAR